MNDTTKEEILRGESKNLEFKVELPKDSKKYMRSVVAFANTQGGQIVVGVDDKTREVKGVDADHIFQVMDSITNAIYASCTPQIVPDISFQTIDDKTVVVAKIAPGANRPYFLTAEGKENGTYIRIAGTSRHASPEKIKELEMEGGRIFWDELTCVEYEATKERIQKLCNDIMRYREESGLPKREVTKMQLINWKLLKEVDGNLLSTNAFALLTAEYFPLARTQCAVFAGTDRGEFIDKRDFEGPLYEQIEAAYTFVLRNIRRSAKVEGLLRREKYELPPNAIREMIINALCHRNYLEPSFVQVALYEDRLEVTSPGGLYFGLTLEEALSGHSRQRNRTIAEVFIQMGLIESWGTGLKKICREAAEYELIEPEFIESTDSFRINLYRKSLPTQIEDNVGNGGDSVGDSVGNNVGNGGDSVGNNAKKDGDNTHKENTNTKDLILVYLKNNPKISISALADALNISRRSVERNIRNLRESGKIIRHGTTKSGYWEVIN